MHFKHWFPLQMMCCCNCFFCDCFCLKHQQNPQYLPPKTQLHLDRTSSFSRDLNAFHTWISVANDVLQLLLLLLFLLEAWSTPLKTRPNTSPDARAKAAWPSEEALLGWSQSCKPYKKYACTE
jgi:hypothetical protein